MIKAILMDFNGVIINDEPIQMRAYQDVLGKEGVEVTEESYYDSLGLDELGFVRRAFDRVGKTCTDERMHELIAAKQEAWQAMIGDELPLFPGIQDFVEKCAHDFSLGIVSMAPRKEIEMVLERAGLISHFSAIVSAEDVSNCKPDPECFRIGFKRLDAVRTALGHLPMTHAECLAIEDSPPGVSAALAADLQALGVSNTVLAEQLRAVGAGAVATDLRDWMPESIRLVFA